MKEFIKILMLYAQEERLIEINRCLLSQNLYFDVFSLYNYILFNFSDKDCISNNIITISILKKFIETNLEIKVNNEILSKLFDIYEENNLENNNLEQFMDYSYFVDIFYPRYNFQLRRFLQERNGVNNNYKSLDNITLSLLKRLFIGEINRIKNLIFSLNNNINIRIDDIFKNISNYKKFITKEDLKKFFNKYYEELDYTEEDIKIIISSLTLNRYLIKDEKNITEGITEENFVKIFNTNKNNSFFTLSLNNFTFKDNNDKNELFLSIIENEVKQEIRIEEAKTSIINRNDFNINKIISILIPSNKEKIELNNFLEILNISLNNFEKELLFKRIDLSRKGYLNKDELFDFFVPINSYYKEKIEKNNNEDNNISDLKLNLSKGTNIYINNLFNIIIKGEKEINEKKIELNKDSQFIEKIFEEIIEIQNLDEKDNTKYKDYFKKEQLYKYLTEKINIKISDKECDLLFNRFDKLKIGKIQILEFSDEMKGIL